MEFGVVQSFYENILLSLRITLVFNSAIYIILHGGICLQLKSRLHILKTEKKLVKNTWIVIARGPVNKYQPL